MKTDQTITTESVERIKKEFAIKDKDVDAVFIAGLHALNLLDKRKDMTHYEVSVEFECYQDYVQSVKVSEVIETATTRSSKT